MAILVPRRRIDFFDANGEPTLRFIRFLESLTNVSNSIATGAEFRDEISELDGEISGIAGNVVVTASDYTTSESEIIICTSALTVFLNPEPIDQEVAVVNIRGGRVDIDASGKLINGESTAIIRRKYTTWDIIYILELDEWVII